MGPGRGAAPPISLLTVPNVTAHRSTASVYQSHDPLLCGLSVAIKGLNFFMMSCCTSCYCCTIFTVAVSSTRLIGCLSCILSSQPVYVWIFHISRCSLWPSKTVTFVYKRLCRSDAEIMYHRNVGCIAAAGSVMYDSNMTRLCLCRRPMHNTYTGVSKVDMSEDIEPVLSKIDVVLTFAIEVRHYSLI